MIEVMERWVALAPAPGQTSWTPVQRMIDAAEEYGRGWKDRVGEIADEYARLLGGLDDPLRVDMAWLERSYEPAYSRWLGWVLEQLGSADAVWRVLGLGQAPTDVGELRARAEVRITPEDRLDVVVECEGEWRVVIETKLGRAEEYPDLSVQLSRYWEKLKKRHPKPACVLIALDAEKKEYEGFVVQRWPEICQRLRGELVRASGGKKSRLVIAMILAFVGAVEQNLLGFPNLESGESAMLYPRVAAHIEESMRKTV
jgi:hypothetical protein